MKPLLSNKNIIGTDEWKAEKVKDFNRKKLKELLAWQVANRAIITPVIQYGSTGITPDFIIMEMSEEQYKKIKENYDKENQSVVV